MLENNLSVTNTQIQEVKTLCSKVIPEVAKKLYKNEVVIEEKETGKRFNVSVVDHCGEDDFGFICRIPKSQVKGLIKKYQMGQAEMFGNINPNYVEVDLRKSQQGSNFYLIEKKVKKPVIFKKISFEQIQAGQTILVLGLNMHKVMSCRGIDEVLEANPNEYHYHPCSDRSKRFTLVKAATNNFEFFVIENMDFKTPFLLFESFKHDTGILPQYTETWAEMYNLSKDEVYNTIFTQLQSGIGFLNFMCLFNKHSKLINDIYFNQHKVKDYQIVKHSFNHIFNPLG